MVNSPEQSCLPRQLRSHVQARQRGAAGQLRKPVLRAQLGFPLLVCLLHAPSHVSSRRGPAAQVLIPRADICQHTVNSSTAQEVLDVQVDVRDGVDGKVGILRQLWEGCR